MSKICNEHNEIVKNYKRILKSEPNIPEYKGEIIKCPCCENETNFKPIIFGALMECQKCKSRFYLYYKIENDKYIFEFNVVERRITI